MQAQRVWFVALYVFLALNCCDSHQHKHNKARSKHTTEEYVNSNEQPEGKIFGWKKQPQTNVIFITRPTAISTSPTLSTTSFISPITTANTVAAATPVTPAAPATITVRRPYVQRYGGYRRRPVRRKGVRRGQGYRRRAGQQPVNRRRVWQYGREEEDKSESVDETDDFPGIGGEPFKIDEELESVGGGGVSAKLDIEQLEKSLLSQQDTYTRNYAGQIAVHGDIQSKGYKQNELEHLKVKSEKPQTAAILAPTMPATFTPTLDIDTTNAANKEPTYAEAVVHSNGNKRKNNSSGDRRQTIWQGISERWRERRKRRKNAALQKQQQEQEEIIMQNDENENEFEYVATENEIVIDENGELHIKKRRKNNNHNIQKTKQQQQQHQQQQLNIKKQAKEKKESNKKLQIKRKTLKTASSVRITRTHDYKT